MARSIPDMSNAAITAGDHVQPEDFNEVSEFSEIVQEAWEVEHRETDAEHGILTVPVASAIATEAAGAVTLSAKASNINAITDNSAGNYTITLDPTMLNTNDWFVDVAPGPVSEPLFAVMYDDGGGTTHTTKKRRIKIFTQAGALTACGFVVDAYGPRAYGATGLGTTAPTASGDVRNRICVDGVESAEHRNKLITFLGTKRTQFARKHHIDGPNTGVHKDIQIPIAVALLETTGDLRTGGTVVWQEGAWDGSPVWSSNGHKTAANVEQRIDFAITPGYRWTGVRVCPQFDGTLGNPVGKYAVPRVCREYGVIDRWDRRCKVDLGGYASGKLADLKRVGLVVYGYRLEWQEY